MLPHFSRILYNSLWPSNLKSIRRTLTVRRELSPFDCCSLSRTLCLLFPPVFPPSFCEGSLIGDAVTFLPQKVPIQGDSLPRVFLLSTLQTEKFKKLLALLLSFSIIFATQCEADSGNLFFFCCAQSAV